VASQKASHVKPKDPDIEWITDENGNQKAVIKNEHE
jgi:hypothetical protein